MSLRVFSYGGGVQSNAALVLAARDEIDYRTFLFANVGDDSEDPLTLDYVHKVAMPYAAVHDLELVELRKRRRDGTPVTLYSELTRSGSRSVPIPVRMSITGMPGARSCTKHYKVNVVGRWLREHGATPDDPATVAIGFSIDELHRCNRKHARPWEVPAYPLIDLRLTRAACLAVVASAGLPEPPKSACWFCPYHRRGTWAEMRRDRPELFDRAVALEALLNERRDALGRDRVYLTDRGRPLDVAIAEAQPSLADGPDTCDEGYCWT